MFHIYLEWYVHTFPKLCSHLFPVSLKKPNVEYTELLPTLWCRFSIPNLCRKQAPAPLNVVDKPMKLADITEIPKDSLLA